MAKILLILLFLYPSVLACQIPFYYKLKKVSGELLQPDGAPLQVKFISRRRLEITGCRNPHLDTFLRTLTLTRISRKYLEHLITSSASIRLDVSDKIGVHYIEGKYRLIAGLTGVDDDQSDSLITDYGSNFEPRNKRKKPHEVYEENTIQIFRGGISYVHDSVSLNRNNVFLYDYETEKPIENFSMDTIKLEPLMHPELMYANMRELYFFCGVHEIVHTTPQNIDLALYGEDNETDPIRLEEKLFRKRKMINRRKIKF